VKGEKRSRSLLIHSSLIHPSLIHPSLLHAFTLSPKHDYFGNIEWLI